MAFTHVHVVSCTIFSPLICFVLGITFLEHFCPEKDGKDSSNSDFPQFDFRLDLVICSIIINTSEGKLLYVFVYKTYTSMGFQWNVNVPIS